MQKCKGCGAEIRWITTGKGKAMPLNANPKTFYFERNGVWYLTKGYETHWATCKQAKRFKRERGEWKSTA